MVACRQTNQTNMVMEWSPGTCHGQELGRCHSSRTGCPTWCFLSRRRMDRNPPLLRLPMFSTRRCNASSSKCLSKGVDIGAVQGSVSIHYHHGDAINPQWWGGRQLFRPRWSFRFVPIILLCRDGQFRQKCISNQKRAGAIYIFSTCTVLSVRCYFTLSWWWCSERTISSKMHTVSNQKRAGAIYIYHMHSFILTLQPSLKTSLNHILLQCNELTWVHLLGQATYVQ